MKKVKNKMVKLNNNKGSALVWAMVVLLVIVIVAGMTFMITTRFNTTANLKVSETQAYHSAYSLTYSIAEWIESYDPVKAESINPAISGPEIAKKDFVLALKNGPITVNPNNINLATNSNLDERMGECSAEVSYNPGDGTNTNVASIAIVSTATHHDKTFSVQALLKTALNSDVQKDTSFDSDFNPVDFGLTTNVAKEISDVEKNWVGFASNPAYMGRTGSTENDHAYRYYTFTKETYDVTKPNEPSYLYVNPRFAGSNVFGESTTRNNRMIYFSNPQNTDRESGLTRDFLRIDAGWKGTNGQDIPQVQNISIDNLDLRVKLDPNGSMFEKKFIDNNMFGLPTEEKTGVQVAIPFPANNFFKSESKLLEWPLNFSASGVEPATILMDKDNTQGRLPGKRLTYFTDPEFNYPSKDTSYIISKVLSGGTNFDPNANNPYAWSVYNSLYLYFLNESDKFAQITGAVSVDSGAIFTKRDFKVGGAFTDQLPQATSSSWKHLADYPTQLTDVQMYFASPKSNKLSSVIQGTPNNANSSKPTQKTRINGGWIVVQNNHELAITDALVNTQREGVSVQVLGTDTTKNGTSTERVTGGISALSTNLWINPSNGQTSTGAMLEGRKSGNDIYVTSGGKLTLGKGALVCSDIYVEKDGLLVLEGDAVVYGNIYSNGNVRIDSPDVRINGRPDEEYKINNVVDPSDTGKNAGGIFIYQPDGSLTIGSTIANDAELTAIFPLHNNKTNAIHNFNPVAPPVSTMLKSVDQCDEYGVCTHFANVSASERWEIVNMENVK